MLVGAYSEWRQLAILWQIRGYNVLGFFMHSYANLISCRVAAAVADQCITVFAAMCNLLKRLVK